MTEAADKITKVTILTTGTIVNEASTRRALREAIREECGCASVLIHITQED